MDLSVPLETADDKIYHFKRLEKFDILFSVNYNEVIG